MTADPWSQEINPCLDETECRMLLAVQERTCDERGWATPSAHDGVPRVHYSYRHPWPPVVVRPLSVAESAAVTWLLLDQYIGNAGITQRGTDYLRSGK